jgi:hypothetical protein
MSETMTAANGRPQRKQLSDQLDRLDGIIDVLADALPGAVADACREGARQAVKDAVVEILASPELRALVAGPAARVALPPAPTEPGPAEPGVWGRVKSALTNARTAAAKRCRIAAAAAVATARALAAVLPPQKFLAVGAGVGVAVGIVCYACPPALSAVIGGAGAACAAVAAQVGTWLRRSTSVLGFGGTG